MSPNQCRKRRNFDNQLYLWWISAESSQHYPNTCMKFLTGETVLFANVCHGLRFAEAQDTYLVYQICLFF